MNVSSNGLSKKFYAGLLAVSMLAMTAGFLPQAHAAQRHTNGSVVLGNGAVWLVTNDTLKGFDSPAKFLSHGYSFSQVQTATSGDLALAKGSNMDWGTGALVNDGGAVFMTYNMNGTMVKQGYTNAAAFLGHGFSFSNVVAGSTAGFTAVSPIAASSSAHPAGSLVSYNGAVWWITPAGRAGFGSLADFQSYGLTFNKVVVANAADIALPVLANVVARNNGGSLIEDGVVVGNVSVSLASDTPASSVLVAGQSTADLAHFNFSGTGTVTSVQFKRIGVSGDSTLSNVYLFDGSTRISDAATVGANSTITFAGANVFTVNGSKNISVRSDILSGTAGQTVGVQLSSFTVSGASAQSVAISGNMFSIASATLATVAVGDASSSPATNTALDPANDITLWQSSFTVGTRDVNFNRIALRNTGSISSSDIGNFKLYVDGVQVASVASQDSNGYVTFTFSKTLTATAHEIRVTANVTGGATRTIIMSLRNVADLGLVDSSYGVNITATGTFPESAGTQTITTGSTTTVKAADSVSGNVTLEGTDVALGKWTIKANAEAVKVETLTAGFTHVTSADGAETSTLRNGRILINGVQYGNTSTTAAAGTSFTVNYTIAAGATATVEYRADIFDNDGTNAMSSGDKITAKLVQGSGNGQPLVSLTSVNVPTADVSANQVTVAVGSMSMAQQSTYTAQSTTVPQTAYKLAAFNLTGSSTEDINVSQISVDFDNSADTFGYDDLSDVYVKYGSSTSSVRTSLTAATAQTWSIPFTLVKNSVVTIEIYANVGSTITAADTIRADATVTGTTVQSATSATTGEVQGQVITYTAGAIAEAADASMPVAKMVSDNQSIDAAAFKWTATNDSYTLTEVIVKFAAAPTTVTNVKLKDGSTVIQTKPGAASVTFAGLSIAVPANGSKVLNIELDLATVGANAGSTGEAIAVTLDSYKATNSQGALTTDTTDVAGNAIYAYAAIPTVARVALPTTTLSTGTVTLGKFTITSNGGAIAWDELLFDVTKTAGAGEVAVTSPTIWDADTNTQVAGSGSVATLGATDASGTIAFDATSEQIVSGSKTYLLKATITSSAMSTGDNINVVFDNNVTSFAASTAAASVSASASLVWSDMSASSHAVGTSDWTMDYLVRSLPLDSWTLTY